MTRKYRLREVPEDRCYFCGARQYVEVREYAHEVRYIHHRCVLDPFLSWAPGEETSEAEAFVLGLATGLGIVGWAQAIRDRGQDCPACRGKGHRPTPSFRGNWTVERACIECKGTGKIPF